MTDGQPKCLVLAHALHAARPTNTNSVKISTGYLDGPKFNLGPRYNNENKNFATKHLVAYSIIHVATTPHNATSNYCHIAFLLIILIIIIDMTLHTIRRSVSNNHAGTIHATSLLNLMLAFVIIIIIITALKVLNKFYHHTVN